MRGVGSNLRLDEFRFWISHSFSPKGRLGIPKTNTFITSKNIIIGGAKTVICNANLISPKSKPCMNVLKITMKTPKPPKNLVRSKYIFIVSLTHGFSRNLIGKSPIVTSI